MKIKSLYVLYSTIFLLLLSITTAHAQNISVAATYKVEFGGFDLGKFRFTSTIENNRYTMNGQTKLSILKGAVMKWKMKIHSDGSYTEQGPKPHTFGYNFRNKKKKKKKLLVTFDHSEGEMKVSPKPKKRGKKYVPLKPEHLRNVYDPMSALMVLTYANGKKLGRTICNKTIRLFDGKERYDIALKYKKVKMTDVGKKSKKKRKTYICGLRYIPIAGHKKKDKTKNYMANVKGMEIWFSPSEQARIYVPHMIKIPTPFGPTTTIKARSFTIKHNGGQQIHFIK